MIPGHGGIMDRFDCQFLMATFVNVYISSFIRTASPAKLLQQVQNKNGSNAGLINQLILLTEFQINPFILPPNTHTQVYTLKPEQQLQLFHTLRETLEGRNILDLN